MKPRLAASISALIAAGERVLLCKDIPGVLPDSQKFNGVFSSFQFQRFNSSKVCNDDDDFSELGPPAERSMGQLKLVTEKPEPFLSQKLNNGRKVSSTKSPLSKSKQSIKSRIVTLDKPHKASCEFGNVGDASSSTNTNSGRSISVGNVPCTITQSQLVKAVSVFGKVSTASVRHLLDGHHSWEVQFKSLESCNGAIKAGALTVGRFHLPIYPLGASMVITIRLKGISKDASFREIHSICKSIGMTEGQAWVSKDTVDALFTVDNDSESLSILKKLNATIVGGHRLSASLLPSNPPSASTSEIENGRGMMGLQINSYLTEIKIQLEEKKMHLLDLEMLHQGIMHLEDLPTMVDPPDI